jgi:hypothetical protein
LRLVIWLICLWPVVASAVGGGEAVGVHTPDYNTNYVEPEQGGEQALKLPAYPKDSDLIEFYAGPRATNHFFIDGNSMSAGQDGIVRYTLVIKTSGGATDVSYEGIRCASQEFKIYATGNNGSWTINRLADWRPVESALINRHHAALNHDFFCPLGNPIRSAAEGLDALRRGKHPMVP